jgi:DMSO/TMAO reductase YedYZ molybdopterin-dependent catalytic subunit
MKPLPPGQQARVDFPRFGLLAFAERFPAAAHSNAITLGGDAIDGATLEAPLSGMAHQSQVSDFHCVTTWSCQGLQWQGVRFADFYQQHVLARLKPDAKPRWVLLRGQDGYRTVLPLSDLLGHDVLLADTLGGMPLTLAHGAPLRIVAPAHYGYKQVKHLSRIEFWEKAPRLKRGIFAFMEHPRARVAFEERGSYLPGWLLRVLYRPLIQPAVARFADALARYQEAR